MRATTTTVGACLETALMQRGEMFSLGSHTQHVYVPQEHRLRCFSFREMRLCILLLL